MTTTATNPQSRRVLSRGLVVAMLLGAVVGMGLLYFDRYVEGSGISSRPQTRPLPNGKGFEQLPDVFEVRLLGFCLHRAEYPAGYFSEFGPDGAGSDRGGYARFRELHARWMWAAFALLAMFGALVGAAIWLIGGAIVRAVRPGPPTPPSVK